MSMLSDIIDAVSEEYIRSKLSQEERGALLEDITDALQWQTYSDLKEAVKEIKKHDKREGYTNDKKPREITFKIGLKYKVEKKWMKYAGTVRDKYFHRFVNPDDKKDYIDVCIFSTKMVSDICHSRK